VLLSTVGKLNGSAECVRSGVGTDIGCVGVRTGSVFVRAGETGLGADVTRSRSIRFRIIFLAMPVPAPLPFSSHVSIGGAAVYMNDRGTIILLVAVRINGVARM
jgi:hypothetical protein